MIKYCLFYEYGVHRVVVEVSKKDFFRVIDDLSKEFQIVKKESLDDLEYCIINYYGDSQIVGFVFEEGGYHGQNSACLADVSAASEYLPFS